MVQLAARWSPKPEEGDRYLQGLPQRSLEGRGLRGCVPLPYEGRSHGQEAPAEVEARQGQAQVREEGEEACHDGERGEECGDPRGVRAAG